MVCFMGDKWEKRVCKIGGKFVFCITKKGWKYKKLFENCIIKRGVGRGKDIGNYSKFALQKGESGGIFPFFRYRNLIKIGKMRV